MNVCQPSEWVGGHVPSAHYIIGAELPERLDEVSNGKLVAVTCGSGYRSSVGYKPVATPRLPRRRNVLGGMTAWKQVNLPTQEE